MNVLITGATGFVGRALTRRLLMERDVHVSSAVRSHMSLRPEGVSQFVVGDLGNADWTDALSGIDVVIHLAARVHLMPDPSPDPLAQYRYVNVAGTVNLARQAAREGVRRFVFLSSVKVFGDEGSFSEIDAARPTDSYGVSKWEAEQQLVAIGAETAMEVVIIRPPLVYGPGAKANFALMLRAVRGGLPLPLGSVHNKRSLIAVDNLVDFIVVSLGHQAAANEVFLVSDGEDLSTTELIRGLSRAANRAPMLFPVPSTVLRMAATLLGKRAMAMRLLSSLTVDISKARTCLGWVPPVSVDEGLRRAIGGG